MSTKDGGSAFPKYFGGNRDLAPGEEAGISQRDYFAVHAPIHDARVLGTWMDADQRDAIYRAAAECAYRFADAMLAARSQR